MSVIQAALNKARLSQENKSVFASEKRTKKPSPAVFLKFMDESLELKLRQVQNNYPSGRKSWWKVSLVVMFFLIMATAVIYYFNTRAVPLNDEPVVQKEVLMPALIAKPALPTVQKVQKEEAVRAPAKETALPKAPKEEVVWVPMKKPAYAGLRLTGIMDMGNGFRAIINNQILGAGDMIDKGVFISEIKKNEVTINARKKQVRLRLSS